MKRASKTLKIDLSADRLLDMAEEYLDDDESALAIKILNKNRELNGSDAESYLLYAEAYEKLGLFEKCVNFWYKFLREVPDEERDHAYNGLGTAYMNLGYDKQAALYLSKCVSGFEDMIPLQDEFVKTLFSTAKRRLKIVYPPQLADMSDTIDKAVEHMKCGEYKKAIKLLKTIVEGHSFYANAQVYIAMCLIFLNKLDEAEKVCTNLIKKKPRFVQAYTTLCAVKTEMGKREESRALTKKLLNMKISDGEDLFKIATVCCENEMHDEACKIFSKLDEYDMGFDHSVLFFKAVALYNCRKYEMSFSAFDRLLTVYPESVTASIIYKTARENYTAGKREQLSYFYQLPKEKKEEMLVTLMAMLKLSNRAKKNVTDMSALDECIAWCFEEGSPRTEELRRVAVSCAVKFERYEFIDDILMDAFADDNIKLDILMLLGERNQTAQFDLVFCHEPHTVEFRKLKIGRSKQKPFLSAYVGLTVHLDLMYGKQIPCLADICEDIYRCLQSKKQLNLADKVNDVTAAMYILAQEKEGKNESLTAAAKLFRADADKVAKILEICR